MWVIPFEIVVVVTESVNDGLKFICSVEDALVVGDVSASLVNGWVKFEMKLEFDGLSNELVIRIFCSGSLLNWLTNGGWSLAFNS